MVKKNVIFFLIFNCVCNCSFGQELIKNSLRVHHIIIKNDTNFLDSLTIDPSTVKILPDSLAKNVFNITVKNHKITINRVDSTQAKIDTISLVYRVLDRDLSRSYARIDSSSAQFRDRAIYIGHDIYSKNILKDKLIQSNQLEYDGSFSRGLSFGNSQDLVLNSNLNLQMNGDLGNGLLVKAAISDDNIPIQPEGNTQVLQEFDKVFVEIQKDNTTLIAGDFELNAPKSYFSKYYKKLKGLSAKTSFYTKDSTAITSSASYAISRGKFTRINLATTEGNQGPYQLRNNTANRFIIVLSGTEKVYLDGRLLKRGLEEEYTIDYNRAEIFFTPNLLITKDSRIIVEYEFADQNYLRSMYTVNSSLSLDKWSFDFGIYNEQDSKSVTGNVELDSIDLVTLNQSGDDPSLAVRESIFPVDNLEDQSIWYSKVFDPASNDSILIFDANASRPLRVVFTDVGKNNGSYNIDNQAAVNGRVYKYDGPNMGSYEPIIRLTAPEKKQLSTLAVGYKVSKNTSLRNEFALSNQDLNRFSTVMNEDNIGFANNLRINDERSLDTSNNFVVHSFANFEFKEENFRALNPYRATEFSRDWNYEGVQQSQETLGTIGTKVSKNKLGFLSYEFGLFEANKLFSGKRHASQLLIELAGWTFDAKSDLLLSESELLETTFFRPKFDINKSIKDKLFFLGFHFEQEDNNITSKADQSLQNNSFKYQYLTGFIETNPSEDLQLGFLTGKRDDFTVFNNIEDQATTAFEYKVYGNWKHKKQSQLDASLTIRDLKIDNIDYTAETAKRTILAKLNHNLRLFNNGLTLTTIYESNAGQEPKLEEQYFEVQKGEGSYIWIDDAPQDSIQQINEFRLAPFQDQGNYQKISIFNNEFVSITKSILNQNLKIEPKKWMDPTKSIKNVLKKLSWNTRYRIDQKSNENSNGFQLVSLDFADTSLVAYNSSFDHSLFINRGNVQYDGSFGLRSLRNKINQINGFEKRTRDEYYTRWRFNVKKRLDIIFESAIGNTVHDSEFFDNRDLDIESYSISPSLNYRPKSNMRFIFKLSVSDKKNTIGNLESAQSNTLGMEWTWRKTSKSNLMASVDYVKISSDATPNSQLELELLEGLKTGNNFLWNLSYTKRLSKSIDMIIDYNGRKTGESRTVHVFGAQVKANF